MKALHKFITIYNSIGGVNTVVDYISDEKMGNISFIARLNYFKLEPSHDFYEYITSRIDWSFERQARSIEDMGLYGIKELTNQRISELSEKMKLHLQADLTPASMFLSNARQLLKFGNNKYAYLEAFLAIETSVEKFLSERKKKLGISDQNLSDFSRETGIGYQINIEIPLVLGEIDQEHMAIINTLNKIRKIRNNIVHRGYQVSDEDVDFAINVVQYYVVYLRQQSEE